MLNTLDNTLVERDYTFSTLSGKNPLAISAVMFKSSMLDSAIVGVIGTLKSTLPIYSYDALIDAYAQLFIKQGVEHDQAFEMAVSEVNQCLELINERIEGPLIAAKQDADAQVTLENGELPIIIGNEEWVILTPGSYRGVFNPHYSRSGNKRN